MRTIRRVYSIWWVISFFLPLILMTPLFLLFYKVIPWHKGAFYLFRLWSKIFLMMLFIPTEIERRFKPIKGRNYIYCSNHFSYFDTILFEHVAHDVHCFIGKSDVGKIPLFGYIFKLYHISVERGALKKTKEVVDQMRQTLLDGKSLIVYPEGGIYTKDPTRLNTPLKNGAFKMAIETGTPIIPVTFPYNWFIMKDDAKFLPLRHKAKAIIHPPIEVEGLTLDDLDLLKQKYIDVVQTELDTYRETFESSDKYKEHLRTYSQKKGK